MKLFFTILLLFSCSYLNSAHQPAPIIPPVVFEPFNPFIMLPIGLNNLGNSCYMNAMLQCLYRISSITKFLVDTQNLDTQDQLLLAYQKFVNSYTYELKFGESLSPVNFHSVLTKTYGWGRIQQDSQEALNNMLDIFPDESKENYRIQSIYHTTCQSGHETHKNESDNMLIIPVTDTSNLIDYLNHYFIKEQMTADNSWNCSSCGQLVEATKQTKLGNLPDYLIIQLGIFNSRLQKISIHPQIPLNNLNMGDYLNPGVEDTDSNYELFGCIWHLGSSLMAGHYVATVKIEDKWYLCSDHNICEILQPEERLGHGYLDKTINNANPYVLFYRKIRLPPEEIIDHAKYPKNQEEPQLPIIENIFNKDNSAIGLGIAAALIMYFSQIVSDWWNKPENVNILTDLTNLISKVPENKNFKPKVLTNSDLDLNKLQNEPYLLIIIDEETKNQKNIYNKLKSKYELIGYVAQEKCGWLWKKTKPIVHIKTDANTWGKVDISDFSDEYTAEKDLSLAFNKPNFDFSKIQDFCFKLKSEITENLDLVNAATSLTTLI